MNAIGDFLKSDFNGMFNLVCAVFGVGGAALGVQQWWQGRRGARLNQFLFDTAKKNLDKSITDEQIAAGKEQIATIEKNIGELQRTILTRIPVEARRAALRDRLDMQEENIARFNAEALKTRAELEALDGEAPLPSDLAKELGHYISPVHEARVSLAHLTTLLVIGGFAAQFLELFPRPLDSWLPKLVLLAMMPVARQLFLAWGQTDPVVRRWTRRIRLAAPFVGGLTFGFAGAMMLVFRVPYASLYAAGSLAIALGMLIAGTVLLILDARRSVAP